MALSPKLHLTIRFNTNLQPDIPLTIFNPHSTPIASLKPLIRAHLIPSLSANRLRLIHAGKALSDNATIGTSLKVIAPPPSTQQTTGSAKGKEKVNEEEEGQTLLRTYVHCVVGDVALTDQEIEEERVQAEKLSAGLVEKKSGNGNGSGIIRSKIGGASTDDDAGIGSSSSPTTDFSGPPQPTSPITRTNTTTTTPAAPQGFDALLTAGFTRSEIANLRSEFLALQSLHHTPDTMPSGHQLRLLEDAWLNNSSSTNNPNVTTSSTSNTDTNPTIQPLSDDVAASMALDDMFRGVAAGFFWPIGGLVWGTREEGVWSWRRGVAVMAGMMVNLGFGSWRFFDSM